VPDFAWRELAGCIDRACAAAGLKQEALAALMGVSSAHLSQMLTGAKHLSMSRLWMVSRDPDGAAFWKHLISEMADAKKVEDRDGIARRLREVLDAIADRRMLRVAMPAMSERRTA
jgi:DNA-binding transcriptional regulator YdaS (Cro superfamily)